MKRSELRNFDIVELRDGTTAVVNVDKYAIVSKISFGLLDEYDDRLEHKDYEELDIMKVVRPKEYEDLPPIYWKSQLAIWERKDPPKLSPFERAILKNTKMEFIARNENGNICFFERYPLKKPDVGQWFNAYEYHVEINNSVLGDIFSFIEWEDDKPWKVKDLLELDVEG